MLLAIIAKLLIFATLDTKSMQETQGAVAYVYRGGELTILDDNGDELCSGRYCNYYQVPEDDDGFDLANKRLYYSAIDPKNQPPHPYLNFLDANHNPYTFNSNSDSYTHNPWVKVVGNLVGRFIVRGEKTLTGHHIQNATLVGEIVRQGVKHNNERRDVCPAQVKCID